MDKKLEVKNLQISFRTQGGILKAVRNISFDLYKGETLAIVGESGSGKSVTSRAIMGILAGNSIVEGGEIIYDGQDLLKISEEDFHKLRGDKVAMIFQDPLSSLNPIMRIGQQLTEAMILKAKTGKKNAKKLFNGKLKLLGECINAADAAMPMAVAAIWSHVPRRRVALICFAAWRGSAMSALEPSATAPVSMTSCSLSASKRPGRTTLTGSS